MLIDNTSNPDKSLYVLGAEAIKLLDNIKHKENIVSIDILYNMFIELKGDYNVTMEYFLYILDWLFMLGLIEIDKELNNRIRICY